ncbi:hypothetical protein F4820DRAFT_338828 [Hypoxylon rubiginosum]|uniref:Uncharacterized protein n=1 Tax=Hypoxylon rubiginosum TaxID=110542 RepID=A0ACB9YYN2_9PEZI|nr:hypothetical protein F4820DRAFT_338828 [Hypoxylon rubiginosum]
MDVPPPPYTETDIYSHSGRSPNSQPGSNDDAASVTESSTHSTIIYTPPETPRESHHSFSGGSDHHTTVSAHSYFESRPTFNQAPGQDLIASLAVSETSSPDDFPFPAWARERDTTEQDWHTFLNYLLPDHAARANSHVVDRKLQAQEDAQSPKSERSVAEAQLGQIKSSSDLHSQPAHNVDAIIREWNDGFFNPRGVTICRQTPFPATTSRTPAGEHFPAAESQPQPQPQEQNARSRWNPFRSFDVNNRGVRLGGLTIDGDRVSFGNSFEVDRNGVRWNGHNFEPGHPDQDPRGGFPAGPGPFGGFHHGRVFGNPERGRGRGGRGGRWWNTDHDHDHQEGRCRSHSASSSSSSSSASSRSCRSDSSIGSLPDWDDLKDTQLPVTKQSVSAWLAHPEQPVTKEMLKSVRSSIKAAKNAPPPADDPAWELNKKALRQEVKAMLARFNELKREQKRALRAVRKEKRQQKRALRRGRRAESKHHARALRENERELKRLAREQGRPFGRGSRIPNPPQQPNIHIPSPPPVPNIHVPSPPPIPNIPNIPRVPRAPDIPAIPNHHQPTGPLGIFGGPGPFGGPGFFGGGGGPFSNRRAPWERDVERARQQAEQARSHAHAQAAAARAAALSQADAARAHARAQAGTARAASQSQVDVARAHALAQADTARARAEAAVAAWTRSSCARGRPDSSSSSAWGQGHDQTHPHPPFVPPFVPPSATATADPLDHKYAQADELEAQLARKAESLRALRAAAEREGIEAARRGDGDVKGGKEQTRAQREAEALEAEMDGLGREVERLRLEADEEMARNLEKEERGWK